MACSQFFYIMMAIILWSIDKLESRASFNQNGLHFCYFPQFIQQLSSQTYGPRSRSQNNYSRVNTIFIFWPKKTQYSYLIEKLRYSNTVFPILTSLFNWFISLLKLRYLINKTYFIIRHYLGLGPNLLILVVLVGVQKKNIRHCLKQCLIL